MAVSKILYTLAFAMGLVMCVQGAHVSHDKKDYHFGDKKDGDVTLLKEQPVIEERHADRRNKYATFVLEHPKDDIVKQLKKEEAKDPTYIPRISEIIVKDQGGGSKECKIVNGGVGKKSVTLRFKNHRLGGKLNYLITITGQ